MAQPHWAQERSYWHQLAAGGGTTGECQRCGHLRMVLERRLIGGLDVKRRFRAESSVVENFLTVSKALGLILSTKGIKKISR